MSTASAQDSQESGLIAVAILIALAIFLFWHYADRILGAVAGAECNTVIELKLEHHAA
ncbi:hypothetical protein PA6566_06798 [Pseudomonas aeruginosa]